MNTLRKEFCDETNTPMWDLITYNYVRWLEQKLTKANQALHIHDVVWRSEQLIDFAIKNGYFQDIPKGQKEGLIDRFEKSINCH
jgi:hypothetical protein